MTEAAAARSLVTLPIARLTELFAYRGLLWALVVRDFELRYAGSALGLLWTQVYPLAQLAVFAFVFTTIFRVSTPAYPLYLFVGIILWVFVATSLDESSRSIQANAGLITRVYFPRELAPLSMVLVAFVDLALSHLVLLLGAIYYGVGPSWVWIAAPLVLFELVLLCSGLALILSTATVYFHDVRYFLQVALLLGMFLTPVFYPAELVPEQARWLLDFNPVANLITMYRGVVIGGLPDAALLLRVLAIDLALLAIGLHVFRYGQRRFPELL